MRRLLKGTLGFTLMELLVVVGILGVLTAMVAPAVSGTKGASQDGQVKSDGRAAQTAVDNFNNKAIDSQFPDTEFIVGTPLPVPGAIANHRYTSAFTVGAGLGLGVTLLDSKGIQIGTLDNRVKDKRTGRNVLERTVLNFDAETDVYQANGSIGPASYVPDFLQKEPDSIKLVADDTRKLTDNIFREYLWLLRRTSPGSEQESRSLQVFRLVEAVCYSGGTLTADGKPDPLSIRGKAEKAFAVFGAIVDTKRTDLRERNTALQTAKKTLAEKQKDLDEKQRVLDQTLAAGLNATAATSNRDIAKTDRDNAKLAVDAAISAQTIAQSNFDSAMGALGTSQDTQTLNARTAGAKCEGNNVPVSLTYQLVFGANISVAGKLKGNSLPVALAQSVITPEDTPTPITLAGSDPEGDPLFFSVVAQPTHGTLSGTAPNLVYTPFPNFNGQDTFSFKVDDGKVASRAAKVDITVSTNAVAINITPVNDAPVALAQSVTTAEDTPKAITLAGFDVDGDALTFAVVVPPSNGSLSGAGATRTYSPNSNFNGPDSFTFTVSDGLLASAPATLTITVTPVNDAPVANAQSATTNQSTAKAITLTGSDVDGDALTFAIVTSPGNGTLSGVAPNLTYTPATGFSGLDSFTFKVNDGTADSAPALVSITVVPVVTAGTTVTITFNSPTAGCLNCFSYTESGLTVQSDWFSTQFGSPSIGSGHLHSGFQFPTPSLYNHDGGCCSDPYSFRFTMGGATFSALSFEIKTNGYQHVFRSSSGGVFSTSTNGTVTLPSSFQNITSLVWDVGGGGVGDSFGDGEIDNLVVTH